jgi:hypothetical protein
MEFHVVQLNIGQDSKSTENGNYVFYSFYISRD